MADGQETPDTPKPAQREFKIPVESAAPQDHVHQGKRFKIPVESKSFKIPVDTAAASVDHLSKIEENPVDPKTGKGEGTYAVKVNGQVKQVPFSKVPHVAAIAPAGVYGHTTFATEADERRFYNDLDVLPHDRVHEMYAASSEQWAHPDNQSASQAESVYTPTWWTATKMVVGGVGRTLVGAEDPQSIPGMSEVFKGTDLDPQAMLQNQAAQGNPMARQSIAIQDEIQKTFGSPLTNVSGSKTFQRAFDPASKNRFSRFVTGTTKSVEGMTSLENLYSLASIYMAPESIAKPMGLRFQGDLATSGITGVAGATEASASSEEGAGAEAWGGMFGNVLVIAGMHYGEHSIRSGVEAVKERDNTATLNDKAQTEYKKKFSDLTPQQKAAVLYGAVEDASPKFRKRVDQEVVRLRDKQKSSDAPSSVRVVSGAQDALAPKTADEQQLRLQAAKNLVQRIVVKKAREEAYRRAAEQRETESRRAEAERQTAARKEYEQRKAEEAQQSDEQRRGFEFTEGRQAENTPVTGLRKTTEREPGQRYEPEPTQPTVPITDRRAVTTAPLERTPQVVAAEAKVQELAEGRMGVSFSALPLARQRVAARWMERFHPEAWQGFQGTPAFETYRGRVEAAGLVDAALKHYANRHDLGEAEVLNPGADIHAGLARLILGRTDINAAMKADPATYKDLNASTEESMGRSFDSLDAGDKIPALAEYLRKKPENLKAFLTPDLNARIESGQHIDLANMEAELADRQQVQVLMEHRDQIRRDMDASLATQLVQDAFADRNRSFAEVLGDKSDASLAQIHASTKELTKQAGDLGLGAVDSVDDIFRVEKAIRETPDHLRTPKMREFMAKLRQVRFAADEFALRKLAERTAESLRVEPQTRAKAARDVVDFASKAADLQDAADNLRAEGKKTEAESVDEAAAAAKGKADAIQAAVQVVDNPPPPAPAVPVRRISDRATVGRETRVVSPRNKEGYPAHYAVVDIHDLLTSHQPFSFSKSEGFDQNGQPRDYSTDDNAQSNVASRANKFDMDILFSNGVTTMEGPAVVDQRGHVISGNGRTLSMLTALDRNQGEWGRYTQELQTRLAQFGINPQEAFKYKNPVLVKVLDNPVESGHDWAIMGTDLNDSPAGGISETDLGAAQARMMSPERLYKLGQIVESLPTFDKDGKAITVREAMRMRSADIAALLVDAGIISPNKVNEFLKEGELNERAKDMFENMLAGLTVTDPAVLSRASSSVKDKLARAGLFFLKMQNSGENWNLASMNTDAVRLFTRAQDASARLSDMVGRDRAKQKGREGATGRDESLVEKFLHPERYLGSTIGFSFDGQPVHAPVHAGVEALAMALEESPREYARMMAKYSDRSSGMQSTMFGAEHPADAFTNEVAGQYGLKVIPEEWGSVVGLSDAVKEEIENGRGPLPVEPAVHAGTVRSDVQPDSSSVTEAIPEGPRTVQDLRKALETHPGMDAEQAEAVTEMFDSVLPRAIGESLDGILGNRRLTVAVGGKEGKARGYHEILEDGSAIIRLCDSADASTFMHEMAHYIRRYLNPADQAVANTFVGAKPGEEWTDAQEERFAEAFERYHFDGGIRRGALEKVFSTLHRAMQSIYNAVTGRKLAQGSKELNAMFDNWYDWTRTERKPIATRVDVDALVNEAKGAEWPKNLKTVDASDRQVGDNGQRLIFTDKEAAEEFIKNAKNGVKAWRMYKEPGKDTIYMWAEAKKGKKLFQSLNETIELARKARDLEAQLKRTTDPREQARLRGVLNGVEDKLKGATGVIGGNKAETKDGSVIQLVHGISEMPRSEEPTTPAQAVTVQQAMGDPTAISLGGDRGKRSVPDESSRVPEPEPSGKVHEPAGAPDGEHVPSGGRGAAIAKPDANPLAGVKAAKLKAPDVPRGTPVVDPETWRGHVEALGLPEGTPPPTVRLDPDIRNLMIYPGQAEAIEGSLSALQQYDATILAGPTGSGKTWMLSAIAERLLGTGGDKVGLIVTRSRNLIHEQDGYVETARKLGVDVSDFPSKMEDMQTGMYAATYAQIRGNRDMLSVPWDFVLFDESSEARNWTDSEQGKSVVLLGHSANKVVYSSATPYHTVMELGYMHKLGMWPKGGFVEWAGQFGLREVGPNTYSGGTSAKRLAKLRQQIIERGQWQTLYKDMDGVESHVAMVPQTEEVKAGVRSIRAAFAMARKAFERARMSRYITPAAGHEAIYLKRYIEGARLPDAIALAGKAIDNGWKPIIFSEYRSGSDEGMDFFHNLPGDLGKKINAMLPPLPDVVGEMRKAFGQKVGIFAGEHNEVRAGELEAFQSGEKDALYMTYSAGGVGASAHDKVGDRPRMGIFLGLPWSGIMFEQGTGRGWRYGTKSNVANVFLTSDTLPEMKVLATKILPRMRALKAAVYGEKIESKLSKNLRESAGIPEEMLQYEQGEEVAPQAAEFEQTGEGANYTHIQDFELPDAKKAKNKGMKYKGVGRKLFQGPKEEDPWEKAAHEAWEDLMSRTKDLPAPTAHAITANESVIRLQASEAGRSAMGSGESVQSAANRKTQDMINDSLLLNEALLAVHKHKGNIRNIGRFVQETAWMGLTSGDKVVEKAFKRAGMKEDGEETKRKMIDFDLRKGLHQGRFQGIVREIVHGNNLKPPDIELMSKVVEGQASTDDPRINKAVAEFRQFTAGVRKKLGDAGSVVVIYEDGKRKEIPYRSIEDDPHYWPRMYDWNKPFVITDKATGKREVQTLAQIMNMPTSDERREKVIDQFAEERGISKLQAQAFFQRNERGVRLAGNVERARQWDIPTYGRDRQAIERYIDQVSTTLAATEVHGQFRQKTDPVIAKLPHYESELVNRIVTSDLDPAHLPPSDRVALSASSAFIITGKMFFSPLKVMDHLWKASLATNTRSLVGGIIRGAFSPVEMVRRARDANALLDYSKSAWMREYGMTRGNLGQKFLDFNGFTLQVQFSRVMASAMGRLWFEKYVYPELVKDPKAPALRHKLKDLYGMSDEHIDNIVKNGYGPDDVRRMELGAANWVTGSNRPSEMPAMFRASKNADPVEQRMVTLFRSTQMLHGFMFKTANLVKRTVFDRLYASNWKTAEPYHTVARFAFNAGLAGFALEQLLHLRHKMQDSTEGEIEERRHEWLLNHPASAEALWWSLANISMATGVQPLSDLFNELATRDPKDRKRLADQHRFAKGVVGMPTGIPGQDMDAIMTATEDYANSFADTGHHKQTPEERRENIIKRLINEEIVGSSLIPWLKPTKVQPRSSFPHRGHTHSRLE